MSKVGGEGLVLFLTGRGTFVDSRPRSLDPTWDSVVSGRYTGVSSVESPNEVRNL